MASIALKEIGAIRQTETSPRPFPSCHTYVEIASGAYLVVSVNTSRNQCIVEFLLDQSGGSLRSMDEDRALASLKAAFRFSKVFQLLSGEGSITAVELARDYRKVDGGDSERRCLLDALHVHLFIGTSNGTVIICNALRGTVMALALFQYNNLDVIANGGDDTVPAGGKANEAILRFALHATALESRPVATLLPNSANATPDVLFEVYVIHNGGRVVLLNRSALDVFLGVAEKRLDGKRPYFALEWTPGSSVSSFPVAGPAAAFAAHVERVAVMKESDHYSAVELQTLQEGWNHTRQIRDAAFFLSKCGDVTEVLRSGSQSVGSLLLCGEAPAIAVYELKNTRAGFSAKRTMRAVASILGGMARSVWGRARDERPAAKPKQLEKIPQYVNNAFFEADATFTAVQLDPSSRWAACYSEAVGRIYVYDITTGIVWRVLKGCRAAEFQWHVARIGGKRVTFLVVHLLLRHAVEVHSLRLGRRVAARHVPPGSVLLRPDTASGGTTVLLLTPSGEVVHLCLEVDKDNENSNDDIRDADAGGGGGGGGHRKNRMDNQSEIKRSHTTRHVPSAAAGTTTINTATQAAAVHSSWWNDSHCPGGAREEQRTAGADLSAGGSYCTPCDVLRAVLCLPLPTLDDTLRGGSSFAHYRTEMKALEEIIKTRFSPNMMGNRCLAIASPIHADNIPRKLTAEQCLNYAELRLLCVENYRRALLCRGESSPGTAEATAPLPLEDEQLFSPDMTPHPLLEAAVQSATVIVLRGAAVADAADVLPAICRIMRAAAVESHEDDGADAPMGLAEFLEFFHCGGYNTEYMRDAVAARELAGDVDMSARVGSVFFATPRGLAALRQQLEIFSALGFTIVDIAVVSLCWLCRAFAAAPAPHTLGSLAGLTYLLRACSDGAFLDAVERVSIPFLSSRVADHVHAESCLLLFILSMLLRQHEKPVGAAHSERYMRLLRQAFALCAVLRHCVGHMARHATDQCHWLRLGAALRPDDPNKLDTSSQAGSKHRDALTVFFFSHAPASLAPLLCENIPGGDSLRHALGGVDAIELTRLVASPDTPWFRDGVWSHSDFARAVVQPLTALATPILTLVHQRCSRGGGGGPCGAFDDPCHEAEWSDMNTEYANDADGSGDGATGAHLAGSAAILATSIIVFERETARLLECPLHFLERSAVPEANLFVSASLAPTSSLPDIPRGSRATRDYFASCRDLLASTDVIAAPLLGARACAAARHMVDVLAVDDAALLPILPAQLRLRVSLLAEVLQRFPMALRCRITEARAFVSTVMLLAFTPAQAAFARAPLLVPWAAMFGPPAALFALLPRDSGDIAAYSAAGSDTSAAAARLEARSAFMRALVDACGDASCAGDLCAALGLRAFVGDLPQLVAFDAAARRLTPAADLSRALGRVMSRHLAARVAAANFRLVVAACQRHCAEAKRAVARENRAEVQRAALREQSVAACMSDACAEWVRTGPPPPPQSQPSGAVDPAAATPCEHRLVACWAAAPGPAQEVERRVSEVLRLPRRAPERADFADALAVLARVAAEGRDELGGEVMRRIAAELPSVATRLANVL